MNQLHSNDFPIEVTTPGYFVCVLAKEVTGYVGVELSVEYGLEKEKVENEKT